MLHLMRKHAGSLMIKIILGAIVVVFVFWGIGSFRERRAGRVAVVNGEAISVAEYREAYDNLIQRLRANLGDTLDEAMIKKLKVKEQAINQLIDQRLLTQAAQRLKWDVSNEELARAIRSISAFQSNGAFDPRQYRRVLDLNRMTPEAFEALQKQALLVQRLERFVSDGVKVSDLEIEAWLAWQNTAVNIQYVLFNPDSYKDIGVSQKEIETYFKEHAAAYQTREKVKVRYVRFDPKAYEDRVTVTEEEMRDYYDANREAFRVPKTVEARHILIKVDPSDKPEAVEEKRKRLEHILERVKKGEDFATLAKAYSEDPSKESGGLIGPFQKEAMVKPFADAAFSLKAGEVSGLVRTPFGWHIIKAEKINEAKTRSFEEAKEDIRKKLVSEKAKTLAYDAADNLYNSLIAGLDLESAAEKHKLEIRSTGFFSRNAPPADLADPAAFASVAFGLKANEISDIQEMNGVYYILQVVEKKPPKTPELETVLDRVKKDCIRKKRWDKAKADAEAFLAAVKSAKSFQEEAKKRNLKVATSGFFKRNAPVPDLGYIPELTQAAFALTLDQRIGKKTVRGEKGYLAIALVGKKVILPDHIPEEKKKIRQAIKRQKQVLAFNTLVSQLRAKADIVLEEGFATQ